MKKYIIILLSTVLLFSCQMRTKQRNTNANNISFKTIKVGECQYLISERSSFFGEFGYGFGFMAHKGDCINPLHCTNN